MSDDARDNVPERFTLYWCKSYFGTHIDTHGGQWNGATLHPFEAVRADVADRERAQVVRFLRHWASVRDGPETVEACEMLADYADRIAAGEHLLPLGETVPREPGGDSPNAPGQR